MRKCLLMVLSIVLLVSSAVAAFAWNGNGEPEPSPRAEIRSVQRTAVDEDGYEYALFPMDCMNITQEENGAYSHKGKLVVDNAGYDGGIDPAYAPFSGTIVAIGSWKGGNWVVLQSDKPVHYADGSFDTMSLMVAHMNDISKLYIGQHITQGQQFYQEGNAGVSNGYHIELGVIKGKYDGWETNVYGVDVLRKQYSSFNSLYITYDTVVYDSKGYNWQRVSADGSERYTFSKSEDGADIAITGSNKNIRGTVALPIICHDYSSDFPFVTTIGDYAFANCPDITTVVLPGSINIGEYAFANCRKLSTVLIPFGVKHVPASAFSGCSALNNISVDKRNSFLSSKDGVLFNKKQTELLSYPKGRSGSYIIPEGVKVIGDSAFKDCAGLTNLTIPASVTEIKANAFEGCGNLIIHAVGDSYAKTYAGQKNISFARNAMIAVGKIGESAVCVDGEILQDLGAPIRRLVIPTIPLRAISELFGMGVEEKVEENNGIYCTIETKVTNSDGEYYIFKVNSTVIEKYTSQGKLIANYWLDGVVCAIDGAMYVPMSGIVEALDINCRFVSKSLTGHDSYVVFYAGSENAFTDEMFKAECDKAYEMGL